MNTISQNFIQSPQIPVFFDLSKPSAASYADNVQINRVPYSHLRRQYRHSTAVLFCLYHSHKAVLPGVRGLQNRYGGNIRIVSVRTIRTPGLFVPILKKTYEVQTMLTASTGKSRPHPMQPALWPAKPTPVVSPAIKYQHTTHGLIATQNGLLVAWICQGYAGSRNNPKHCHFYDVAYLAKTHDPQQRTTGLMLDSDSFDALPDALEFVESTFADGVAV